MHSFFKKPNTLSFILEIIAIIGGIFMIGKLINTCFGCISSSGEEEKVELELGELSERSTLKRSTAEED